MSSIPEDGMTDSCIKVSSQAELDEVLKDPSKIAILIGDGPFVICDGAPRLMTMGSSQPHVEAMGSSHPHVEAMGSSQPHVVARECSHPHVVARECSQPHVEAWGSSHPHVVAMGSSQPHVVARGSSQPHLVARGYCQVSVRGAVRVTASEHVTVLAQGSTAWVDGGHLTRLELTTAADWCAYYDVSVNDGVAVLFKAVRDDYQSGHGFTYPLGGNVEASDWDGGGEECGGGLHFVPHPMMGLQFDPSATRFIGCAVALADMRAPREDDAYLNKIKARRCSGIYEVDRTGKAIKTSVVVAREETCCGGQLRRVRGVRP